MSPAGLSCHWLTVEFVSRQEALGVATDFTLLAVHLFMVAPLLNQHTWCPACSAALSFFSNFHHLLLFSVRFGHMAIHVEVPGDFGQGELHALKFWSENNLASQPGVLLKHGCHVQHVVLPKTPKYLSVLTVNCLLLQYTHFV